MRSMTGFGSATAEAHNYRLAVEIRTVNNRYFKLQLRLPDGLGEWEPRVEKLVRESINRGTITIAIRLQALGESARPRLQLDLLQGFARDLQSAGLADGMDQPTILAALLSLPGIVHSPQELADPDQLWPLAEAALTQSLQQLADMRDREGQAMADEMHRLRQQMAATAELVEQRSELAADTYRELLLARVRRALGDAGVSLAANDVLREVCLFADKVDIAEELTRLRSHLRQLADLLDGPDSAGRKIDFLTQELNREVNTMGAKSADAQIAQWVVDMKCALERLREIVQNVE